MKNCLKGNPETIMLCGFNNSRKRLNDMVREYNKYAQVIPYPNERIICLKNNRDSGIMNGQIATVIWWMPTGIKDFHRLTIEIDNYPYPIECLCWQPSFGGKNRDEIESLRDSHQFKLVQEYSVEHELAGIDFFDYGYATTVHKAQGSEWESVILFEQHYHKLWNSNRFLYTAVTRARRQLFIISDFY
jgi:exodeoxyribonuclease-5